MSIKHNDLEAADYFKMPLEQQVMHWQKQEWPQFLCLSALRECIRCFSLQ